MPRINAAALESAHLIGPGKLKYENAQLAFIAPPAPPVKLQLQALRDIHCYGPVGLSDRAMDAILKHGIDIIWFTANGNACRGRVVSNNSSQAQLRLLQMRTLDSPDRLPLAKWLVTQKIASQREVLRHLQRHGGALPVAPKDLHLLIQKIPSVNGLSTLLGIEGQATALWFQAFATRITPPFSFHSRIRRPPTDPVNALLSLAATFLLQRAITLLQAAGLETALGALHEFRPGRPSLACDLIEPFRASLVERWTLGIINTATVRPHDFANENSGCRLTCKAFPRVLLHWESSQSEMQLNVHLDTLIKALIDYFRSRKLPEDEF